MTNPADYGVQETNPIDADAYAVRDSIDHSRAPVPLENPDLVKILRLRLLGESDFPFMDVSYCYGEMRDGTRVRVEIGASQLRKRYTSHLIELAADAGRDAESMNLLNDDVISVLWS
ncbi:hypothetical protein L3Q65_01115 (plasmid) [Amycolatopsis sp. FU40]|uniref:hypothetical protein n=1 Tax=Amycolatopsis sp. FU40 TaxID=2914159 RepID=UPI001F3F00AF|nr:hypothetical protein [Amycolatopsis sp. FU40]UKD50925.1 hypothetical protein L3Q65_01115 [Amycolatopsis sp. FU40]